MTDKLLEQIQDFADAHGLMIDDEHGLYFESDEGVIVELVVELERINGFDDLHSALFDIAQWYDIDEHVADGLGVDPLEFEASVNSFDEDWIKEKYGDDFPLDEVVTFINDAYAVRSTVDRLAYAAAEKGREIEKEMAKNIELEKDAIIVDDNFVVTLTGRDYDFVAIINNTANEDITLYIDGEEFISVQDGDWVGLTNVDLETLQEGKDDIVVKTASQIKEEREQQNKHKNIDER